MPNEIDMNDLLAEVSKFQSHIREVHSRLTHPQEKQLLGDLIEKIDESQAKVEVTYPKAIKAIEEGASRAKAKSQANKAKAAKLQEQLAAAVAAQQAAKEKQPPAPEEPEFDFQLGDRLSSEMFALFAEQPLPTASDKITDREIWQDWSWTPPEKN